MDYILVGVKDFTSEELSIINDYLTKGCRKLSRRFPAARLQVQPKKHKHHYTFHVHMDNPSFIFKIKHDSWDLTRGMKELLETLDSKLEHTFKLDGHNEKRRI